MRRALLQRAGFTIPRGATFSVGRSANAARKFADRTGYPVVVKPAIGDNTIEVMAGLSNARQLNEAIEYLRTPPKERGHYVRAAYALTELREPGKRRGRIMVPPGYRFLVEQHISGQYLRVLVLNDQVRSVIHCEHGPWDSQKDELHDVLSDVHPSIRQIAVDARQTIPGLPLVAIDMIVPDYQAETSIEDAAIVEFSERPWLAVQETLDPQLSSALGAEILRGSMGENRDTKDQVTVAATIEGVVEPTVLLHALTMQCRSLNLVGSAEVSDPTSGTVSATLQGEPAIIAWLMESLLAGKISTQRPMLIDQRQTSPVKVAEFSSS